MKEITTKKLLDTIIEGVRNRKGQRIVTIDLRKIKEAPVEMMLICEGQSNTQVSAIADEIDDFVRIDHGRRSNIMENFRAETHFKRNDHVAVFRVSQDKVNIFNQGYVLLLPIPVLYAQADGVK